MELGALKAGRGWRHLPWLGLCGKSSLGRGKVSLWLFLDSLLSLGMAPILFMPKSLWQVRL